MVEYPNNKKNSQVNCLAKLTKKWLEPIREKNENPKLTRFVRQILAGYPNNNIINLHKIIGPSYLLWTS